MVVSTAIESALTAPIGARFFKCALQVNPFQYVIDNARKTSFADEVSYNAGLVAGLVDRGIEVIAITDHFRVAASVSLWRAAEAAGIIVLPGFEAVSKEGVHYLCLFDRSKRPEAIERAIGACGVHGDGKGAVGGLDSLELLQCAQEWGAAFVAAHVVGANGLLSTLKGAPRAKVWTSPLLMACSLPGPVSAAQAAYRDILSNRDPAHKRQRPVAVVNAKDVSDPSDLDMPGTWSWIKASEMSVEGLRQAFLDPESRIRLPSDPVPEPHTEFLAVAWEGGFLDGVGFRFNENLNTLIGGRGSGKSTVIESLRYVLGLEPVGTEARKSYQGIVANVLRDGTKISLLVRSHLPAPQDYLIERTVPNDPLVRSVDGAILPLTPGDVAPFTEVYGQHEIAELARSPEKLTLLLRRFIAPDPVARKKKTELRGKLARSRSQVVDAAAKLQDAQARLSRLPALEERLKRYQTAGVETRLKERSQLVTEERILTTAAEATETRRSIIDGIAAVLPIERSYLDPAKLKDLKGRQILEELEPVLAKLEKDLEAAQAGVEDAIEAASDAVGAIRAKWDLRKSSVQDAYAKVLRELQTTRIDAKDFLTLRKDIEELVPVRDRLPALEGELKVARAAREGLLADWEDAKTSEFRELDRAADGVTKQLASRVRVQVSYAGNREPLFELLREDVGGRLSETIDILRSSKQFSVAAFTRSWRVGAKDLVTKYGIPVAQADRLAGADEAAVMRAEELDLPPSTEIELNLSTDPRHPAWQKLDDLSTGQKATAVLLLLLLESEAPLVVDQPEDDLDNRFISEGVVPKMREEKRRRQFVFATHNANIPVLGDAELIVGMEASGEAARGRANVSRENIGSIDNQRVSILTEELLEGGRTAFEMRRMKYGF